MLLATVPGTDVPRPAARTGRPGPDPEVAAATMRTAGYEPLVPYPGSNVPWPCTCLAAGHAVFPHYTSANRGHGCRLCLHPNAGSSASEIRTDVPSTGGSISEVVAPLGKTRPRFRTDPDEAAAVMLAAGVRPDVPFPGSNTRWAGTCTTCDRPVAPRLSYVRRSGRACPYCSGCATDDTTRLAVMQAAGFKPAAAYPGNNKTPWPSTCLICGTDLAPRYDSALSGNAGCGLCAGRMLPSDAEREFRAAGFEPLAPFPGVKGSWPATCTTCKRTCTPSLSRVRGGTGCIHCAGKTTDPAVAADRMLAAGYRPLVPYPGRNSARWRSECQACRAHIQPSYKAVMNGHGGGCCRSPFHLDHPSKSLGICLVVHDTLGAVKVGIGVATDETMPRLAVHRAHGWRVHWQCTGLRSLYDALDVEAVTLDAWRTAGLPPYLTPAQMPQAGWTETADLTLVDLAETVRLAETTINALTVRK